MSLPYSESLHYFPLLIKWILGALASRGARLWEDVMVTVVKMY